MTKTFCDGCGKEIEGIKYTTLLLKSTTPLRRGLDDFNIIMEVCVDTRDCIMLALKKQVNKTWK